MVTPRLRGLCHAGWHTRGIPRNPLAPGKLSDAAAVGRRGGLAEEAPKQWQPTHERAAPAMASSWTKARSNLARAIQRGDPPETITALRRDYTAARAEHYLT